MGGVGDMTPSGLVYSCGFYLKLEEGSGIYGYEAVRRMQRGEGEGLVECCVREEKRDRLE